MDGCTGFNKTSPSHLVVKAAECSQCSDYASACCAVMQLQFYGSFVSPAGATQRRPPAGAGWPGAE